MKIYYLNLKSTYLTLKIFYIEFFCLIYIQNKPINVRSYFKRTLLLYSFKNHHLLNFTNLNFYFKI